MKQLSRRKTQELQKKILDWGETHFKKYPWREPATPWLGLVAEVLLQRTNASHVARYYQEFCDCFPTPESVLTADTGKLDILKSKFGLNRRIKTLISVAEYIDTKDIYPSDAEELISIYGIGHYTSATYLSLHMNVRAVLIDSNIARWLSRLTGLEQPKDLRRNSWLKNLLEHLTPTKNFRDFNYAILDLTMTLCRPKKPKCESCPVKEYCDYFSHSISQQAPNN